MWAFPSIGALFEAPLLWEGVLLFSIAIAAVSTRPHPSKPWWPRFHRKLAWCGLATVPLGWGIVAAVFVVMLTAGAS